MLAFAHGFSSFPLLDELHLTLHIVDLLLVVLQYQHLVQSPGVFCDFFLRGESFDLFDLLLDVLVLAAEELDTGLDRHFLLLLLANERASLRDGGWGGVGPLVVRGCKTRFLADR